MTLNRFIKIAVFVFGNIISTTYLFAQYNNIEFKDFNKDERLLQSHVLTIYQDKEDFLWVGVYNGLYRFDGYNFVRYNQDGEADVIFNDYGVHAIFEDDTNHLWVGTENGLIIINKSSGKITHFVHDEKDSSSLCHNFINAIAKAKDGEILVGSYGGGLSIYNREQENFSSFKHEADDPNSISSNLINTIFTDNDGEIWIGTEGGGISLFDIKTHYFKSFTGVNNELKSDLTINSFLEDNNENIWIGTWNSGAFKYNKNQNTICQYTTKSKPAQRLSHNVVRSMTKDWNGNIWLATYGGGVNIYDTKRDIIYNSLGTKEKSNETSELFLWSIYKDKSDVIWLGTFGSGLYNYNRNKLNIQDFIQDENLKQTINNIRITSLNEDKNGWVWIGTLGNGVYTYNAVNNKLNHLINYPNQPLNNIRRIFQDQAGKNWIGTDGGLLKMSEDGKSLAYYTNSSNPNSISKNGIYSIYEDQKGNIWVGTWGQGINMLKHEEINKTQEMAVFEKFSDPVLSTTNVWSIRENQNKNILIATNKGLIILDVKNNTIKHKNNFDVSSIFKDNNGDLWIGTFGNGILKYNQPVDSFDAYNTNSGLNSNICYGFFTDSKNNIWISTNKGLTRISQNLEVTQNYTNQKDIGLSKIGLNASCAMHNGQILLGGEGGLKIFNPDNVYEDLGSYPLYITDVKLFNKTIRGLKPEYTDIPGLKNLTITYKQNFISFDFAALNFSEPNKMKYAYKLEGNDEDWIYTDASNRTATYKDLKGGTYNFIVRSLNTNGTWNKNEASITLKVIPPFWAKLYFKIGLIALIFSIIILIIRSREKGIHKNYLLKEELLKSEKLIFENKELNRQIASFENQIAEKENELTSSAIQLISKNQVLSSIRADIQGMLPNVVETTRRKLDKVIYHINVNLNNESDWEKLNLNLNLIQDNFLTRFAEQYPEITHKDLKICAYIRMNLSNEEIAELLNISRRGLEMCRYRIRKKTGIDKKTQLNDFILRF